MGQVIVADPPFVNSRMKPHAFPPVEGFEIVNVVFPTIVAVIKEPLLRLIFTVPETEPKEFMVTSSKSKDIRPAPKPPFASLNTRELGVLAVFPVVLTSVSYTHLTLPTIYSV